MTRVARLLAPVLVALSLAGCGGDGAVTKAEYERELRSTMDELEEAYGSAAGAVMERNADNATKSVADVVSELRTAQIALRDAGNRLEEIEPPTEIEDTHEELVAGVRDMADAVDLLIEAQELADRDPAGARQLAREFASDDSFQRVEAAAGHIEEAGVDAGL